MSFHVSFNYLWIFESIETYRTNACSVFWAVCLTSNQLPDHEPNGIGIADAGYTKQQALLML